ncbi:hypothetical protein AGMMS50249_6850 [candidate division SR1 bacterium]|nr:hypothetical protein AGMMS50249_6850 [candidate division SR1 bacterium]
MKKVLILSALVAIGIIGSATYADSLAQEIIGSVSQKSLNYQVNFINQVNDYLADEKISQDESKSAILNEIKNSVDVKTYTANGIITEIKSLFSKEKASQKLTFKFVWDGYTGDYYSGDYYHSGFLIEFAYDASGFLIASNPYSGDGNVMIRVINNSGSLAVPCLNLPKNAQWNTSDRIYLNDYTDGVGIIFLLNTPLWTSIHNPMGIDNFSRDYHGDDMYLTGIKGMYDIKPSTNKCSFICKKGYTYNSKTNTCNTGLEVDKSAQHNLSTEIKAQTMTAMPIK